MVAPRRGTVPNKIANSYTDFLASWTAQLAVMASLIHRAKTGRGMWIDLAMYQVGVSFVGEGVLDFAFNGRRVRRMGNRHETIAPHGCYPCEGNDQWVVVAARETKRSGAHCARPWVCRSWPPIPDLRIPPNDTGIRMTWTR